MKASSRENLLSLEQTSVDQLKGVGPRQRERLQRIGIRNLQDLLFHLPLRYQDRSRVRPLNGLVPHEEALVEVEVCAAEISQGRRRSLKVRVADGRGLLLLRFFHFSNAQVEALKPGRRLRCFGEVRQGPQSLEMIHPELRPARAVNDEGGFDLQPDTEAAPAVLTPVYPSTEGLQQSSLRSLTEQVLERLRRDPAQLTDWVPEALIASLGLPSLAASLLLLHRPPADAEPALIQALLERSHPAFQRLAFDEMLGHQLALRRQRAARRAQRAPMLRGDGRLQTGLQDRLPFALTGAQRRVIAEIGADLDQSQPMSRLLLGDVGSGKTLVAAMAALQAVEAGTQVALMAPTELLSEQHLQSISAWLEPLSVEVAWLAGRHSGAEREAILARVAAGDAVVVVGTHALFQADVVFARLGLVIIDEQHRFGVHQRLQLREKGATGHQLPHQLIMTATPIPRSLAMSVYGDLDLSELDELPPGRRPIATVAVPEARREEVIARVQQSCALGRQAYWVCTLVEESDALQAQAAEATAAELRERLPQLRIGLVHGRIKGVERAPVMAAFKAGELDLLVATTVIEVGVDVPNASLMIIENAERLGLAQLHQLRGRVGRGRQESACVLLYRSPLGQAARERLAILRRESSGFRIAEADLQMRGAGEVLGTRQAGNIQFRLADPVRDASLSLAVRHAADRLLVEWPQAVEPLIRRWLGDRDDYGRV